ncbi:MAG TPA: molybdate ABC transporter permease subunit [Pyrinomonadaceae bacterium]
MNWSALMLSLQVTLVATIILFVVGLVLGVFLARFRVPGQIFIEIIIFLPLVLPPSVIGYLLLLALGRGSPIVEWFHVNLLFSWYAAAIASAVVGLPLMFQSARTAIASVDHMLENAARTLGSSELEILWRVTLPLARRGVIAGLILGGARALGEFGATLMVAGNIPGQTQTLPLAIYDAVQARRYDEAQMMVVVMTAVAFIGLWCVRQLERPLDKRKTALR